MLLRLRHNFGFQLALLVAAGALALLIHVSSGYLPLLRPGIRLGVVGFLSVPLISLFLLPFLLLGLYFPRSRLAQSLLEEQQFLAGLERTTLVGGAISAACGEEFILRGLLFGALMDSSLLLAGGLSVSVSFILYLHRKTDLYRALVRATEASCYCYLFYEHRSLFLIGVARFSCELISTLALRTPWALYLLQQKRFSWRNFYGAKRVAQSSFQRV